MIVVKKYLCDEPVDLFCPEGEFISRIENVYQWYDVKSQLKKKRRPGYYVMMADGTRVEFDHDGRVIGNIPKGLFDLVAILMREYMEIKSVPKV